MPTFARKTTPADRLIGRFDRWLKGRHMPPARARPNPAADIPESRLSEPERREAAALMRVNHAGEVCAQALYRGQALTAHRASLHDHMLHAAAEEADHLAWCSQRLQELQDRTSYLDPVWYLGSYSLGSLAGFAGDRWSLGFVAETEHQVEQHLEGHRRRLPAVDRRSRAIVEQMQLDEARHGRQALEAGGSELPFPVRLGMRLAAKVMTTTAHRV